MYLPIKCIHLILLAVKSKLKHIHFHGSVKKNIDINNSSKLLIYMSS